MGWRDDALCARVGGDIFFPNDDLSTQYPQGAKSVCVVCPVRAQCLEFALENDIGFGVWGNMTPPERARLRKGAA